MKKRTGAHESTIREFAIGPDRYEWAGHCANSRVSSLAFRDISANGSPCCSMAASAADDRRHTVLVFAPVGRDGPLTRELLERAAIDTLLCNAIDELCTALMADADAVILTEEALDVPSFSTLVAVLDRQPAWSDIPVLVFGGGEETRTSLRTLAVIDQLRNVTLIERPIRLAAVLSIVRSALRSRLRQYELRDVLLALHAARAEAEDASRMKDEFLATLSHELRTPLNAILGWTTMLRHGQVEAARVPKVLDVVDRNARAQAQLIEDVLDMSRIITGKLRVDTKPLRLLPLVEAAIDSIGPAADAKGVTLALRGPGVLPAVRGDADRLQQVFWNLLSNAVKFTPAGGHAEVVVEREGSNLRIDVGDTGAGLAAEFLPFVFDRFRQADQSVTRGHGGLGLGLAIVQASDRTARRPRQRAQRRPRPRHDCHGVAAGSVNGVSRVARAHPQRFGRGVRDLARWSIRADRRRRRSDARVAGRHDPAHGRQGHYRRRCRRSLRPLAADAAGFDRCRRGSAA